MRKHSLHRILTVVLALVLVFGTFIPTVVSASDRDAGQFYDETTSLKLMDPSNSTVSALNGKTGTDVKSQLSVSSLSKTELTEEELYVESVAETLTVQLGLTGFEGKNTDKKYAMVWMQELPESLGRVYTRANMNVHGYANAKENARTARTNIKRRQGSRLNITHEYSEVFNGFAIEATLAELTDLANMPGVYAITEVSYYSMDYIADPGYTTAGNLGAREVLDIASLHAAGIDGTGTKVGIIDSGIDANHVDLVGALKGGWNFAPKGNKNPGGGTADLSTPDGEHGTHVAGTIASQGHHSLGIAPGAAIYMAQVFTPDNPNSANEANVTAAIEAFTKGDAAKGLPRVDVINMSMGNTANTAYSSDHYTRNNAVIAGVLIVNSAGNNAYPDKNTTDRRNYTLGSGGVSLTLSVAASKFGGSPDIEYTSYLNNKELSMFVENTDALKTGVYKNGDFGNTETHSVTYKADNSAVGQNVFVTSDYYGTYVRRPLNYVEGKGFELYYACKTTGDMTAEELTALKAMPKDSLVGKILVVNRGQAFTDYLGEGLRLGAGGVIVLNRDNAYIGNMTIGNASANDMVVFSGLQEYKQVLLDTIAQGQTAYLMPGYISDKFQLEMEVADFSSIGPVNETAHIKPDVIAPGWSILSTVPGGYEYLYGTSMSSPWVAGLAALVKQTHPDAQPAEIKARIMNTADKDVISPLSTRLSNPGNYFYAEGTELSVFEQGAGFVNAHRAVYDNAYITVLNPNVPTGNSDKSVMTAQMGSFSFGPTMTGTQTDKLTATVFGGTIENIEVVYNKNTRYSSRNLNDAVTVNYTINGNTFDVWLDIASFATTTQTAGNLYEGYIMVTVDGVVYTMPWGTRVGEFKEPESDFWLLYADRPVQATYQAANQDWSPYSSQNYFYFMFDGKEVADSVALTTSGNAITGYTYVMYIYMITAPNPAIAYRFGVTLATGQRTNTLKLSSFITIGNTYQVAFNGRAYGNNGSQWLTALSNVAAGSYNLAFVLGSSYNWRTWNGITFTNTRPTLSIEGTTLTGNSYTQTPYGYADDEVTINGRIYSAALAQAQANGFMWAGLHTLIDGEIYSLDQSYNVLANAANGDPCYNDEVGPYICDEDGYFSLTFAVQDDGYFFPEDFCSSGVVYATDAFNRCQPVAGYAIYYGNLASFQWCPLTYAVSETVVTSATLTNGVLTAQFMNQDGTIPAAINAEMLNVSLFVDGTLSKMLTEFTYNAETGIAQWNFAPYITKGFVPQKLLATVTYEQHYITTTQQATAISTYITNVAVTASVQKLNGNKNNLTIIVTEYYSNGTSVVYQSVISIDNNAIGTYQVNAYRVYVDTKGNTQIRACYIV